MVTIEELRQQTANARALAEQKRAEALQIKSQLEEQERALPSNTSQTALRDKLAGLKGRNIRRQIGQARQDISARQEAIQQYQEEVLTPYEQGVSSSEQAIQEYDIEQQAYNNALNLYDKKIPLDFVSGPEYKYLKKLYQQEDLQQEFNDRLQGAVDKYNQGASEGEAFKGLNIDYLKRKGILKFEEIDIPAPEVLAPAVQQENLFFNTDNLDQLRQSSAQLPRQDRIRGAFLGPMIPLVSAAPVGPVQEENKVSNVLNWASTKAQNLSAEFRKKDIEVYNPTLGQFVSASPGGSTSTATFRYPSEKEKAAIETAKLKGSFSKVVIEPYKKFDKAVTDFFTPKDRSSLGARFYAGRDYGEVNKTTLPPIATQPFNWAGGQTLNLGENIANSLGNAANRDRSYSLTIANRGNKGSIMFGGVTAPQEKGAITNIVGKLANTEGPLTREQAKALISAAYTFAFFEPAMRTATSQQLEMDGEEEIEIFWQGRLQKKTKKEWEAILGTRLQALTEFKLADRARQLRILKMSFKNRVYLDSESLLKDIENAKIFMRDAGLQESEIDSLIFEMFPQLKPKVVSTTNLVSPETTTLPPIKTSYGGVITAPKPPKITGSIGGGRSEMFPLVSARPTTAQLKGISFPETLLSNRPKTTQKPTTSVLATNIPKTSTRNVAKTFFGTLPRVRNDVSQTPRTFQVPKTNQDIFSDFGPISQTKQTSQTRQTPRLRQDFFTNLLTQSRLNQKSRFREEGQGKKGKEELLKPLLKKSSSQGFFSDFFGGEGSAFDIFVRKRKKDVKVSQASNPFLAGGLLTKGLKGSLAASGFVVERGTGRKLSLGELGIFGPEFRPSKRESFRIVQERGFRLGTGAERQQIKAARRQSINWLGSTKRNKSQKIRWF